MMALKAGELPGPRGQIETLPRSTRSAASAIC